MINNQIELEEMMANQGTIRAIRDMENRDKNGLSSENAYARIVYDRFVEPVRAAIQIDVEKQVSRIPDHILLLKPLDLSTVSYIAVRTAFSEIMKKDEAIDGNFRKLATAIGEGVQGEEIMRQFENVNPSRYYYLMEEMKRRNSHSVARKVVASKKELVKCGNDPISWPSKGRTVVGTYLLSIMENLGMVELIETTQRKKNRNVKVRSVILTDEIMDLISQTKDFIVSITPYFLPCVEKPKDWVSMHDGGWHTDSMRKRALCSAVLGAKDETMHGDCSTVYEALNALQSVSWEINDRVLNVARELSKDSRIISRPVKGKHEIVGADIVDKPPFPESLANKRYSEFNEKEKVVYKEWGKKASKWHRERNKKIQARTRMYSCFSIAEMFLEQPEVFFVYHCDFRGRAYPCSIGPNPQGSDLQKSLIHFSKGKPLRNERAVYWFFVNGANKFGKDKLSLDDRVQWVKDNHDLIMEVATNPTENTEWYYEADKPFQFLAWAFEYKDFVEFGPTFESKLSVGLDGSCNGLQNFSALFRDEVGGKATNLLPSSKPNDIYTQVATCARDILINKDEDENGYRNKWVTHGFPRKLVKRTVMTLPYGSTRFSSSDFILNDYMNIYKPIEFTEDEYAQASIYTSKILWEAIGKVVVKAREGMDWFRSCAREIIKHQDVITWTTPNGFVVRQDYKKFNSDERVRISIFGGINLRMGRKTKEPDPIRHVNGISPNFIHSMDAAHMQRVVVRAKKEGIDCLHAVHDDFGTTAADTERFYEIIREEFVNMYDERDWVDEFAQFYLEAGVNIPDPPSKGTLDIKEVMKSKYFFS